MNIDHIAIWTIDLEKMKAFYCDFFGMRANQKYFNSKTQFSSYFLSYDSGARIELMHRPDVALILGNSNSISGLAHVAISVGSIDNVNKLTSKIEKSGYKIVDQPRTTGDGYYESVVLDPEENRIEITV